MTTPLLRSLKSSLFRIAHAGGILSRIADSRWRWERLLILCYHGVSTSDEHEWNPALYVTPAHLRARLMFLRKNGYNILPLADALQGLRAGCLPRRSVAITFDDGSRDFATHAVPILREFTVPATVYLTTYYARYRIPVFDTGLSYVLWRGRGSDRGLSELLDRSFNLANPDERLSAWHAVKALTERTRMNGPEKHNLLRRVGALIGVEVDDIAARGLLQIMSPDQVSALPRDLIDVQVHTHRHRTPRVRGEFDAEINENRSSIRLFLQSDAPLAHFCYPSGDYARVFIGWLRDHGFESATTCVPGLATKRSLPLLLPRLIDTPSISTEKFEAWASGFAEFLPRRRQYRFDHNRA